ncbi:hypothetical protein LX87_03162 [Larkinella arboricola]|uniref:Uncharacterized protein n=1 Tax=Larkinella arboricola TaxID=643671 RepID=A0A327WTH7_LARAB|nr:hypothetical protein [Larkinella arboricola]RAJ95417.1 hypothetical protein LX87_03162 [Larkinella arboricola]
MKTNRNNLAKRELLARLLSGDRSVKQVLTGLPPQPWDPQHLTDEQIHKILYRHRDQIGLSEEQKQRCFTPEPYPYYCTSSAESGQLKLEREERL